MKPYYEDEDVVIYHADCRDMISSLPKVDLLLTDPPYGIGLDLSGLFAYQIKRGKPTMRAANNPMVGDGKSSKMDLSFLWGSAESLLGLK